MATSVKFWVAGNTPPTPKLQTRNPTPAPLWTSALLQGDRNPPESVIGLPERVIGIVGMRNRPGELIPRCFWLLTSMPSGEMSGEDLLALYRRRGKAEGHLGELMSVVAPALSSTSRRKSHYRGKEIRKREKGVDAFACNQVRLLLAGFGYQIMHVQRAVLERVTGTGWSLRRLAERVLRTPARPEGS